MISFRSFHILEESYKDAKSVWLKSAPDRGNEINSTISIYKDFVQRNIISGAEKDITYWIKKPFDEFKSFVTELETSQTEKKEKKKALKEDAELVFDNSKCSVYHIKSHEASCKYGAGTKWCVTSPSSGHWDSYTNDYNVTFYYIILKIASPFKNKDMSKIAVAVYPDNQWEVFDAADKSINPEQFSTVALDYLQVPIDTFVVKMDMTDMNHAVEILKKHGWGNVKIVQTESMGMVLVATYKGYDIYDLIFDVNDYHKKIWAKLSEMLDTDEFLAHNKFDTDNSTPEEWTRNKVMQQIAVYIQGNDWSKDWSALYNSYKKHGGTFNDDKFLKDLANIFPEICVEMMNTFNRFVERKLVYDIYDRVVESLMTEYDIVFSFSTLDDLKYDLSDMRVTIPYNKVKFVKRLYGGNWADWKEVTLPMGGNTFESIYFYSVRLAGKLSRDDYEEVIDPYIRQMILLP
jgi:hypothetical protein